MKKYLIFTKFAIKEQLANKGNLIGGVLLHVLLILICWQLWTVISAEHQPLHILSTSNYVWYIVLTELVIISNPTPYHQIDADIRTGNFAYFLNRPISYLMMRFFEGIGRIALYLPILFLSGSLTAFLLTHQFPNKLYAILPILTLIFFAVVLAFIYGLAVCLLAFWLREGRYAFWIYNKFVFIFGGLFIPLTIFPNWFQTIALYTPFVYILYKPASLIYNFSWPSFFQTAFMILLWTVVGFALSFSIYRFCLKKVEVQGG